MGIKDLFKKVVVDKPFEEAKRNKVNVSESSGNNPQPRLSGEEYAKQFAEQYFKRPDIIAKQQEKQRQEDAISKYSSEIPEGCNEIPAEVYHEPIYGRIGYNKSNEDKRKGLKYADNSRFMSNFTDYDKNNMITMSSEHMKNLSKHAILDHGSGLYREEEHPNYYYNAAGNWQQKSKFYGKNEASIPYKYWTDYRSMGKKISDCAYIAPMSIVPYDEHKEMKAIGWAKVSYVDWKYQGKTYTDLAQEVCYGSTNVSDKHDFAKMYEDGFLTYSEYIAWAYTTGVTTVDFWDPLNDNGHNFQAFDGTGERIPDAGFEELAMYATKVLGQYQLERLCPHESYRMIGDNVYPERITLTENSYAELVDFVQNKFDTILFDTKSAGRIAKLLPTTFHTIGDEFATRAEERVKFVTSFDKPYQRVAALLVAYLPIDHDNLLESMTFSGGILDRLDDFVKKGGMSKEDRFKIQQLVLSVSDIEDPLHDQFRRYYICGANNLRELCEFRNKFYEMELGIQRSIAARADRNMIVKPTEKDYLLADYEYAIKSAIHKNKGMLKGITSVPVDKMIYDNSMEQNGCVYIWGPSFSKNNSINISDNDAKWISISAKDATDFNNKLYTLLPDLIQLGADIYVASKQVTIESNNAFISGTKECGHHIMIKQGTCDLQRFFDKHPELLTESGVSVSSANHLCGCIYGYYGMFGEATKLNNKFTLNDFIEACKNHPIEKSQERFKEELEEFKNRLKKYRFDAYKDISKNRDKLIWNFYAANRGEFEKYREPLNGGGYNHPAFGSVRGERFEENGYKGWKRAYTVAQEVGYAREHDPFGFNRQILEPVDYEIDLE